MANRPQQQMNFKTDVNRMKTTKWTQAAKANYGGDDWGGYDEYDDYDEPEEPPPPPKPTGLRQRGQGTATSSDRSSNTPTISTNVSSSQHNQSRSPTFQQQSPISSQRPRAGSFETGDDSRGLPAGARADEPSLQASDPAPRTARSSQGSSFTPTTPQQRSTDTNTPPIQTRPQPQPRRESGGVRQEPGNDSPGGRAGLGPSAQHVADLQQNAPKGPPFPVPNLPFQQASPTYAGQPPPRRDSRTPPANMAGRGTRPGQGPPFAPTMQQPYPPSQAMGPNGRPSGPPRPGPSAGPFPPGNAPYANRDQTPPGARGPQLGPRSRPPPPQDAGLHKRPSQEYGPRTTPSQEFPPRQSSSQIRQSPSREFPPRQRPSQEFRPPPRKESLAGERRPSMSSMRSDSANNVLPQEADRSADRRPSPNAQQVAGQRQPEQDQTPKFVRPADIYRRFEQEKEKERQSTDGGRPSLDSVGSGGRPSVAISPAPRTSQDSTRESGNNTFLRPKLDPVAERRSEYGLDGFIAQDPDFAKVIGSQVNTEPPAEAPSLPQFDRFSGFGLDLMGDKLSTPSEPQSDDRVVSQDATGTGADVAPATAAAPAQAPTHVQETDLQHQPSVGFRSAVNQAFDGNVENATLSPISGSQRSHEGSDFSRTDSTGGISPIMSRVPSAATAEQKAREAERRNIDTPAIAEEVVESASPQSRPNSSSTLKGPVTAGNPNHARSISNDSASASIKSGYRRSMKPPSPSDGPARVTAISSRKEMAERSQEGEIAMTSPVQERASETIPLQQQDLEAPATDLSTRETDIAQAASAQSGIANQTSPIAGAESNAQKSFMAAHPSQSPIATLESPRGIDSPRSESPAKSNRVRDLATKYNEIHHTSRSRGVSPSGSISSWSTTSRTSPTAGKEDIQTVETPSAATVGTSSADTRKTRQDTSSDLAPPVRPALPGAWISYAGSEASAAPSFAPSGSDNYESANEHDTSRLVTPRVNREASSESVDLAPNTEKQPLAGKTFGIGAPAPLAALSAAGAALGDSLKSVTGIGESVDKSPMETPEARERSGTDATERPTPQTFDEVSTTTSTNPPTPPGKDTPSRDVDRRTSGYFPPTAPLNVQKDSPKPPTSARMPEPDSATSATSDHLSLDASASDTENDRLRKDIARSLSPPEGSAGLGGLAPVAERQSAMSSIFPSEYDAYWAHQDQPDQGRSPEEVAEASRGTISPADGDPSQLHQPTEGLPDKQLGHKAKPSLLDTRFSFEKPANVNNDRGVTGALGANDQAFQSGPVELETPPIRPNKATAIDETRPMPAELSGGDSKPAEHNRSRSVSTSKMLPGVPASGFRQGGKAPDLSQTEPRTFRQIMTIKNTNDRIGIYQQTRDQFASQPTGLNEWVAHMVSKHPEHVNAVSAPMRPLATNTGIAGSVRNKMPPSLAKFGKSNTGEYTQSPVASDAGSPASSQLRDSPTGSKRQELLHQAGKYGGKASQGAKGLFAKSKSRFRGVSTDKERSASPGRSPLRQSSLTPKGHIDVNDRSRDSSPNPVSNEAARVAQPVASVQVPRHSRSPPGDDTAVANESPTLSNPSQDMVAGANSTMTGSRIASTSHGPRNDQAESLGRTRELTIANIPPATSNETPIRESHREPTSGMPEEKQVATSYMTAKITDPKDSIDHTLDGAKGLEQDSSETIHRSAFDDEKIPVPESEHYGPRGFSMWSEPETGSSDLLQTRDDHPRNGVNPLSGSDIYTHQGSARPFTQHTQYQQADEPTEPYMPMRHTPVDSNDDIHRRAVAAAVPDQSWAGPDNARFTSQSDVSGMPAARRSSGNLGQLDKLDYSQIRSGRPSMERSMPSGYSETRSRASSVSRRSSQDLRRPMPSEDEQKIPPVPPMPNKQFQLRQAAAAHQSQRQQYTAPSPIFAQNNHLPFEPVMSGGNVSSVPDPYMAPASQTRNEGVPPATGPELADAHRPPIPKKSRNRLSKRHSAGPAPPKQEAESPQSPHFPAVEKEKVKPKRSSMFGSLLGRSSTRGESKEKARPNKLTKADRRKSADLLSGAATPPSSVPAIPETSTGSVTPVGKPSLPNVEEHEAMSRPEENATGDASMTDFAGYYGPKSRQTPVFEQPPSVSFPQGGPPQGRRAQHLEYLQSQGIMPQRQPTVHQPTNPAPPKEEPNLQVPHRAPSGASSIYTARPGLQHHESNGSYHGQMDPEEEYARRVRPLSTGYAQFSSGPYGDAADDAYVGHGAERPLRRQTLPPRQSSYERNWMAGGQQMYGGRVMSGGFGGAAPPPVERPRYYRQMSGGR